jgi:hypothetical protein
VLKTRRGRRTPPAFNTCRDRSPGPSPDAAFGLKPNTRRIRCRDADRFCPARLPEWPVATMRAGQDRLRRWALPGHRVASLTPWTRVTAAWPALSGWRLDQPEEHRGSRAGDDHAEFAAAVVMTTSPVTSSVRRYASAAAAQREQRRGWLPGDRQRHPDGLPASTPGFSGESIGALDSADLHAAVHHQSDHPQQADDGDDEKQGVGASYCRRRSSTPSGPPTRPTRGLLHEYRQAA